MFETKEDAQSKLELAVQALDRHTDAIERMLVANSMQIGLEGNTSRRAGAGNGTG